MRGKKSHYTDKVNLAYGKIFTLYSVNDTAKAKL